MTPHHHEYEYVSLLQTCVPGSSDIQEDHSEEQRQEEEDVRGLHRDATIAHVLGGSDYVFCLFKKLQ